MKNNKKIKKLITITITTISVFLFFFIIANNNIVNAVDEYVLLESLPGMGEAETGPGLGVYLQGMYKIGLGIAGILAVVMITIGGVMYMTTEAVGDKSDAKNKINNAIFGLILALSSFLLLKTINPAFIGSDLSLTPVPGPGVVEEDPVDDPEVDCYCYTVFMIGGAVCKPYYVKKGLNNEKVTKDRRLKSKCVDS